jgi:hypothetical protein
VVVLLLAWLPARLTTPSGGWVNERLFAFLLITLSAIYWRYGTAIYRVLDVFTGRRSMDLLGSQVLEEGWTIHPDITGPALHGKYRNFPMRFQRLSGTRWQIGDLALMLDCPMTEDFECEPTLHAHGAKEKGCDKVFAIQGFKKLFGVAGSRLNLSRLDSEPIQWLGHTGLLLIVDSAAPMQSDPTKFREALDALADVAQRHSGL